VALRGIIHLYRLTTTSSGFFLRYAYRVVADAGHSSANCVVPRIASGASPRSTTLNRTVDSNTSSASCSSRQQESRELSYLAIPTSSDKNLFCPRSFQWRPTVYVTEPSHIDEIIAPLRERGVAVPKKRMHSQSNMPTTRISFHRGFGLRASTTPTGGGLHSANLVVEEPGRPPQAFNSLDFFYDDEQAISYATIWGRIWVDSRTYTSNSF